jgi:site-specific DNA-methyltransferase (adenine-specific)
MPNRPGCGHCPPVAGPRGAQASEPERPATCQFDKFHRPPNPGWRPLRGGDRPRNAEKEFAGVSSLPRGCYEPWGLFRKPLPAGCTVSDCPREFQTGGLRRRPGGLPFADVIGSERTPRAERRIARHPGLKPQSFLRQVAHACLPRAPASSSTRSWVRVAGVAAAEALGLACVGVERVADYFALAQEAVPQLAALGVAPDQKTLPPAVRRPLRCLR